jgi:glycosyltransferase involved in cell wall biosynthesis|tara:strand:+ start:179 stop:868 length:690 start_codon:yes stop_codon:yes gene_type:complete
MKLSIIVPCYNEESTIKEIIRKINSQKDIEKEIIVIDDCSTDQTRTILKNDINDQIQKLILNPKNFGKGYSIREGIRESTGDLILIQDADLEYDPSDFKKLINPILEGFADVVYGSRFIGDAERRVLYFWHMVGNKFLTLLSNMLTNLNLSDMEVCYKVFRSEIIKDIDLKEDRFGFEPEITAKIAKKNIRIYEVGVKYFGRTYSDGKKITWKDGFSALRCIFYYNLLR